MTTVPAAGDVELIERLLEAVKPFDDVPPSAQSMRNIRVVEAAHSVAASLAAANERADENWKLAEEERHDANHWHAECEALSARLAEAEREAAEDRRLIGDLRARIVTLTEAVRADLVGIQEAAQDLLNARENDNRTVGYRSDLWDCLRAALRSPADTEETPDAAD